MKNLTLRIDEAVLAEARKQAALKGTTVAKLVREFLIDYVASAGSYSGETEAAEKAQREPVGLAERSRFGLDDWKWNRDEIYEDRLSRFSEKKLAKPAAGFAEAGLGEDTGMVKTANRPPTLEEMTTDTGAPPAPGHDAWFRRQVQRALDDKKSGKAKYEDFEKVAAEFGFNAR